MLYAAKCYWPDVTETNFGVAAETRPENNSGPRSRRLPRLAVVLR